MPNNPVTKQEILDMLERYVDDSHNRDNEAYKDCDKLIKRIERYGIQHEQEQIQ